jgi:NADPH-dependent curcumin reductase CurA
MSQSNTVNRRIVLNSRPTGAATVDDFRLEQLGVPDLQAGQVLLRTLYLSLDPYMRGRMSDAPSYAPSVALGEPMVGATVSRVQASRHPDYAPGELVLAMAGWQDYALSDGTGLSKLDAQMARPSLALGILGMPGFTAYVGLLDIGRPRAGETVVVAAASGAVGAVVGQIAKLKGCRAVGIAGGADKCRYVVDELGFDECIDRRGDDLPTRLAAVCPRGIDVYFESVGGAVFDAVLPLLNVHARVPLCGLIAHYDAAAPAAAAAAASASGPVRDRLPLLARALLVKRIKIQGFIIFDYYGPRYREFLSQMNEWVSQGKLKSREDVVDGLEQAPQAFIGLLQGKNFGKLLVRVAQA